MSREEWPNIERVHAALRAKKSRRSGKNWQCPAHDDRNPSLSVDVTEDGWPLLYCHAGCSFGEIVNALGVNRADLRPPGAAGQAQLFPKEKYAPTGRTAIRRLPASVARDLWLLSTYGRYLTLGDTRVHTPTVRHIAAVIIERKHGREFRQGEGISPDRYRKVVAAAKACGFACRCNPAQLTLFVRGEEACPNCKRAVSGTVGAKKRTSNGTVETLERASDGTVSPTKRRQPAQGSLERLDTGAKRKTGTWSGFDGWAEHHDPGAALAYLAQDRERLRGSGGWPWE